LTVARSGQDVRAVNPRQPPQHDADRLAKEAAFHDVAFGQQTRQQAWKFYAVASDAYERYGELLAGSVTAGSRALEYGCGPGSRAFDLARAGASVNGIDISPVAIELARETALRQPGGERTTFDVMDAEHLAFPDASFDLVCGTSIIHHLDVDRAYGEVARVLKPGGIAVFLEALGHNPAINGYRRLTPALRTEDEHPLHEGHLRRARAFHDGAIRAFRAAVARGHGRQRPARVRSPFSPAAARGPRNLRSSSPGSAVVLDGGPQARRPTNLVGPHGWPAASQRRLVIEKERSQ